MTTTGYTCERGSMLPAAELSRALNDMRLLGCNDVVRPGYQPAFDIKHNQWTPLGDASS